MFSQEKVWWSLWPQTSLELDQYPHGPSMEFRRNCNQMHVFHNITSDLQWSSHLYTYYNPWIFSSYFYCLEGAMHDMYCVNKSEHYCFPMCEPFRTICKMHNSAGATPGTILKCMYIVSFLWNKVVLFLSSYLVVFFSVPLHPW